MSTISDDIKLAKRYLSTIESATARKISFDLTLSDLREILYRTTCPYSGVEMTDEVGDNQKTLDRVDSTKGYTRNNIIACSKRMNSFKGNLSIAELKAIVGIADDYLTTEQAPF